MTDHFKKVHPGLDQCCCQCLSVIPTNMLSRHIYQVHHKPNNQLMTKAPKPVPKPKVAKPEIRVLLTCKVCLLKFKSQDKLDSCMKRHHEVLNLKSNCICPLCEEEMPKLSLTGHFKQAHRETGKTCCPECLALVTIDEISCNLRKHITSCHHSAGHEHLCPGKRLVFVRFHVPTGK